MLIGEIALATAAMFTGVVGYINIAEHPARLHLDDESLMQQFQPSARRGLILHATLAALSGALGIAAFFVSFNFRWLLGAALILANWPFTIFIVKPTDDQLMATAPQNAHTEVRSLVEQWGRLHALRTALGLAATVAYIWAAIG